VQKKQLLQIHQHCGGPARNETILSSNRNASSDTGQETGVSSTAGAFWDGRRAFQHILSSKQKFSLVEPARKIHVPTWVSSLCRERPSPLLHTRRRRVTSASRDEPPRIVLPCQPVVLYLYVCRTPGFFFFILRSLSPRILRICRFHHCDNAVLDGGPHKLTERRTGGHSAITFTEIFRANPERLLLGSAGCREYFTWSCTPAKPSSFNGILWALIFSGLLLQITQMMAESCEFSLQVTSGCCNITTNW
jgi:hypothetical protein